MGGEEARGVQWLDRHGKAEWSQAFCGPAEKTSVGEDTAPLNGEGRARALHVSIAGADATALNQFRIGMPTSATCRRLGRASGRP